MNQNPLRALRDQGQSFWLDFISRDIINNGELKRLIDVDGLSGMTSNPTIFQKSLAEGRTYDPVIRKALGDQPGASPEALYERIAVEDIQMAADLLRPTYDSTGGADGYVSLEPRADIANDGKRTLTEVRRLRGLVARPNVMIKVPATPAGVAAVEELIAEGININITLMFSTAHYEAVANAYIKGIARCRTPHQVASVASIFVSRIDTAVDKQLKAIGTPEAAALRGTIAVANSKLIYRRFRELFQSEAFLAQKKRGARVQRVLWGSTGTKDPAYSDVLYVDELIGPDTVNTLPPATINAFRDHGRVRTTVTEGLAEAANAVAMVKRLGIDLGAVTEQLQREGVDAFAQSMESLLAGLKQKRQAVGAR